MEVINSEDQKFRREYSDHLIQAKKDKENLYIKTIMMEQSEIVTGYELSYMQERLQGLANAIESLSEQKMTEDKFKLREMRMKNKL